MPIKINNTTATGVISAASFTGSRANLAGVTSLGKAIGVSLVLRG